MLQVVGMEQVETREIRKERALNRPIISQIGQADPHAPLNIATRTARVRKNVP
jgi:hypothetical protein